MIVVINEILCNIKLADIDFPILEAKEWIGYIADKSKGIHLLRRPIFYNNRIVFSAINH
jgi:hypothetical protein